MPDQPLDKDDLDLGANIGLQPERGTEAIPGGVRPQDERISPHESRPRVSGEWENDGSEDVDATKTDMGAQGPDGQVYGG